MLVLLVQPGASHNAGETAGDEEDFPSLEALGDLAWSEESLSLHFLSDSLTSTSRIIFLFSFFLCSTGTWCQKVS